MILRFTQGHYIYKYLAIKMKEGADLLWIAKAILFAFPNSFNSSSVSQFAVFINIDHNQKICNFLKFTHIYIVSVSQIKYCL